MRPRDLLYTHDGEPRLALPGFLAVIATFIVALAAITFTNQPRTEEDHAHALVRSGKPAQAERIFARLLHATPTVPLVLALLDAHEDARLLEKLAELSDDTHGASGMGLPDSAKPLREDELDRIVDDLPEDVALVGRFARGLQTRHVPNDVRDKLTAAASREPPVPWANHLLGRQAEHDGRHEEAATFFEKEGIASHRGEDIDAALQLWMKLDSWDTLRDRLADPRVSALADPHIKYRLAVHDRDWRSAARWLPAVWAPRLGGTGVAMSAVAALAWGFFCARLGKMSARVRFRLPLYLVAFLLGVASVVPTVFLIAIEEAKLKLVETGDPTRDIIFFVFGVGLREEAAKLLLFAPLLLVLRKWGDKLDVLVCGALVGLGFAAEENLAYLAQENLHSGLGRFLTANFFHMAMTGTLASALDDFVSDTERHAADFMRTSFFVVAIHGAYDFLLSHEELGGSYLAMTAFIFLTRLFLDAVDTARRRADRGLTPLHAFIFAVAVVTGVSLAYATVAVGPKAALLVTGGGLLGQAIIVYVFVRTLRTM